ncbi:MAG: conjugal transfer protein TraF [Rickettsiales bacterium]|nr:conjugal transfer protein TraF [Rickettsiales bacterium]
MYQRLLNTLVLSVVLLLLEANSALAGNRFYNDRERGWYYRECINCEEKEEPNKTKKSEKSLSEVDSRQVLDTLESVQKELQVRQARFTLEPTVENARAFLDYQRLMFNNGTKAGEAMQSALIKYPYLDSRIENPIHSQAIRAKEIEQNKANDLKIKEFAQEFQLLYFFKQDCPYCHEFYPVLENIRNNYGFEIEAISSDGAKHSDFPTRIDNGLSAKLNITTYPTIIAYNSKNDIYLPVSRGFMPESDFKLNILHVYAHIVKLAMEVE